VVMDSYLQCGLEVEFLLHVGENKPFLIKLMWGLNFNAKWSKGWTMFFGHIPGQSQVPHSYYIRRQCTHVSIFDSCSLQDELVKWFVVGLLCGSVPSTFVGDVGSNSLEGSFHILILFSNHFLGE